MLWKKPVAWHCNSYSTATVPDYINNPMFQEIALEKDYFGDASHERFYIDLRDSLGYTREIKKKKHSRNNTELTLTIELKSELTKKWGLVFGGIQMRVSLYVGRWWADIKI